MSEQGEKSLLRLRRVYKAYRTTGKAERLWGRNPGSDMLWKMQVHRFVDTLEKYGIKCLNDLLVLDVGCGRGNMLDALCTRGAQAENLFGVDLLDDRIFQAQQAYPKFQFSVQDARQMSFADGMFDLVLQSTVFSSILDDGVSRCMAGEMLRVVKNGGLIFSYDVRYRNILNANTRPIKKAALRSLFPHCRLDFYSCTLIPGLVRVLAPCLPRLCLILENIPILRTHYLTVIRKNKGL